MLTVGISTAAAWLESHLREHSFSTAQDMADRLAGTPDLQGLGRGDASIYPIEKVLAHLVDEGRVVKIDGHRHIPPAGSGFPLDKIHPWRLAVCQCPLHPVVSSADLHIVRVYMIAPSLRREAPATRTGR